MISPHERFKLGIEAVAFGYCSAFVYGTGYVLLSEGGPEGFRFMWMAYALAFLAPLLVPLAAFSLTAMRRYARNGDERFSYWRAALLGAFNGELLILPGTAVYVLRGGDEVTFEHTWQFLAFGFTSGLVPFCAGSFMVWAALKNLRLDAKRRAAEKRRAQEGNPAGLRLENFPASTRA